MVKTAITPPEEEEVSGILISDLSNPIWGELLRLLEDQEQAAVVLDVLVQAITSRAIEEDLPDASKEEHVERASALVASKLSEIEELTGATDLQRRQQLLLATRTIITELRVKNWSEARGRATGSCRLPRSPIQQQNAWERRLCDTGKR